MFAILLGISLKSAAILAIAWLVTLLLRRRSAAARRLVWTAAAAAVLALPALSFALPAWRLPAPRSLAPANVGLVFRVIATAVADPPVPASAIDLAAHSARAAARESWRSGWRQWTVALWALGCSLVLLQMLAAFLRLARRRRASPPFPDSADLPALAASLGISTPVALLEAPPASMPMAAGLLRPAIFLPADAVQWSEERCRLVLLHELAHVRSGDVAAHLIARLALCLNWWNPLAWFAWSAFLKECERAADDLVLAAGARPSVYAGHLLEVARSLQSPDGAAWAALAMARKPQLEGRLAAILDARARRARLIGPAGRFAPLAAAIAAIALVAPFAAVHAQDPANSTPPELDATIAAANSQKNHEILEHAAAAYEKLQKYDVAQTLLEKALALRGEVSGDHSPAYAAGLVQLGDLELQRNKEKEALAFYSKAVALGDRPEVAGALIQLGVAAMGHEGQVLNWLRNHTGVSGAEADLARDYFQRAINVDPTGPKAGAAYTWMAEMRRAEPSGAAEAESLYQKALAVEPPHSAEAANTMHLYARFLQQNDRSAEADEMEKQARALTASSATRYAATLGPPAPGVPGDAFKVGNGVTAPHLLYKTEPEYTEEARAAKYQGTVLLYVEIGADGRARNMKVVRGLGLGLDEKAIQAVSNWRFQPGTKDGQPTTVQATIEVNFRLL